jgi:hypothetical protein
MHYDADHCGGIFATHSEDPMKPWRHQEAGMADAKTSAKAADKATGVNAASRRGAKQFVEGSTIRGGISQLSDQPDTEQHMRFSSAETLKQRLATTIPEFSGIGLKGSGRVAVVVAGIVAVVLLGLRYLH